MINTENNESVLDVVKKKKFIKNIYSKIVNLENEVEFGESLTSATLKNVKRGYDYQRYEKLTNEKLKLQGRAWWFWKIFCKMDIGSN